MEGVLDLGHFKTNIYPIIKYIDDTTHSEVAPSYMAIYRDLRDICLEQQAILRSNTDETALCTAIRNFPRLSRVTLRISTDAFSWWLEKFWDLPTNGEGMSKTRHLATLSKAIYGKERRPQSLSLCGLESYNCPSTSIIQNLLSGVEVLILQSDKTTMNLLSEGVILPKLCKLDMRYLSVHSGTLAQFINRHSPTLNCIRFDNVDLIRGPKLAKLSPGELSDMLEPAFSSKQDHNGWILERTRKRKYSS
jgi:hypothetical protein